MDFNQISRRYFCLALGAATLLPRNLFAAADAEVFVAEMHRNARNQTMPYRLFVPPAYDKRKQYPLVLWLCGSAGRGNNNLNQISLGNVIGTHVWTTPESQAKHPCFVVAPQCPDNETWSDAGAKPAAPLLLGLEIVNELQRRFPIAARKLYVAGQSMGGFGTWSVISAYPEMFAAAIPLCGGGDTSQAAKLTRIPIWAFHGARDETVNPERSRSMIAAVRKAGGQPRYTEYPEEGHTVWTKAFNEPELLPWVFAQSRRSQRLAKPQ
jgi:predicted peptidase